MMTTPTTQTMIAAEWNNDVRPDDVLTSFSFDVLVSAKYQQPSANSTAPISCTVNTRITHSFNQSINQSINQSQHAYT